MQPTKRLAAWLLMGAIAAGAAKALHLRFETKKLLAREIPRSIGMGDSLQAMVDTLERELEERIAYENPAGRDPLALRRVVKAPLPKGPGNENLEAGAMRLSATLVSQGRSSAIIKYKGHSYTLQIGDTLEQRVVKSIDKRTVVLDYRGAPVVLVNQPAPRAEIQSEGGKRRLEELQL